MHIHKGTHRIVLVVGPFVVKIAKVSWKRLFRDILKRDFSLFDALDRRTAFIDLFGGLMENIREINCYFTTRHRLLVPVWLPLLVVNIYPKVRGVGVMGIEDQIFYAVAPLIYQDGDPKEKSEYEDVIGYFHQCSHTFDTGNFSFDNGRVRFVDYGEQGVKELITLYGDRLEEHLLAVAGDLMEGRSD